MRVIDLMVKTSQLGSVGPRLFPRRVEYIFTFILFMLTKYYNEISGVMYK